MNIMFNNMPTKQRWMPMALVTIDGVSFPVYKTIKMWIRANGSGRPWLIYPAKSPIRANYFAIPGFSDELWDEIIYFVTSQPEYKAWEELELKKEEV
jgi:hypothetical protein